MCIYMPMTAVLDIDVALPSYVVAQDDVRNLVRNLFQDSYKGIDRLLPVFEHTQIERRYFSQPLSWFESQRSFAESSAAFSETALALIVEAAEKVLSRHTPTLRQKIDLVVAVTTTGVATPSLDAKTIQALGLPKSTRRIPVWGLGCAGGVAGLARTASLLSSLKEDSYALMVAVELCSLTFQRNDVSKSNIVASSLFADGAAALLLGRADSSPSADEAPALQALEILDSFSYLFDDSEDIMGWDIIETGLKVRFSRDIPTLIRSSLPGVFAEACASWGVSPSEIRRFIVHGGGAKVLEAYSDSLPISPADLEIARSILRAHGNMSSVSVLFAAQEFCRQNAPRGELGVMIALGPGFSAEFLLFRR
jgi:alkylresorcinol/alkylpyrone synthase